jgi:hypothetical protein
MDLWMKPIINLDGMGLGSEKYHYPVPPGHFWMPRFYGMHLSVDYTRALNGWDVALVVAAHYCPFAPTRIRLWRRWRNLIPALPECLRMVNVPVLNVEYVGGAVIEAHLRPNPDFAGRESVEALTVVWEGDDIEASANVLHARENCDGQLRPARVGFIEHRDTRGLI